MELEIEKNIVVSTAHVTEHDIFLLAWGRENDGLIVYDEVHWLLVYLRGGDHDLSLYSPQFRELYSWARAQGDEYSFLKLDADGPILPIFPPCQEEQRVEPAAS